MNPDLDQPPVDTQITNRDGFLLGRFRDWFSGLYLFITNYINGNGMYPPEFTTAERDGLTGMRPGQMIFNKEVGNPQVWDGSAWQTIPYL